LEIGIVRIAVGVACFALAPAAHRLQSGGWRIDPPQRIAPRVPEAVERLAGLQFDRVRQVVFAKSLQGIGSDIAVLVGLEVRKQAGVAAGFLALLDELHKSDLDEFRVQRDFSAAGRRLQRLGRAGALLIVVGRLCDVEIPVTNLRPLQIRHMELRHLVRSRAREEAQQRQLKAPARLVVCEGRRVLGAFGVEAALEEIGDLLKRERLALVAGGDRVAFNRR
jgi:hypothetical protein